MSELQDHAQRGADRNRKQGILLKSDGGPLTRPLHGGGIKGVKNPVKAQWCYRCGAVHDYHE